MSKGRLIVFEGIEGSGKTSQIAKLKSWFDARHLSVQTTREPGGTRLGDALRTCLLHQDAIHPMAELCLMVASRSQHVHEVLRPALANGQTILCDRFVDSSMAYQGYGRGLCKDWIADLNARICQDVKSDVVFIFDLPVAEAMARLGDRALDRIESESWDFFERVRSGYLELARHGQPYVLIDAMQAPEAIFSQLLEYLG